MSQASRVLADGVAESGSDRRREPRQRVIKGAQLIFQGSVIDCTVLDVSPNGARVRTSGVVVTPEQVILQFRGGSAYFARRRWSQGTEMSFVFDRPAPLKENAALVASSALGALLGKDLEGAIRILRAAAFLDDPALGQVAEEAEAAVARLETALKARAIARRG